MFDVIILTDIEMQFTGREKASYMLEHFDHSWSRLCNMHL